VGARQRRRRVETLDRGPKLAGVPGGDRPKLAERERALTLHLGQVQILLRDAMAGSVELVAVGAGAQGVATTAASAAREHEADEEERPGPSHRAIIAAGGGARAPIGVLLGEGEERSIPMATDLRRGDRVEWSFRGWRVVGTVRRKVTARTEIDGRVVAASKDDPRYVVRSEKSGKETVRRRTTLRPLT
jgi:hypothetical protein